MSLSYLKHNNNCNQRFKNNLKNILIQFFIFHSFYFSTLKELVKTMSNEHPKISSNNLAPIDYLNLSDQELIDEYNNIFKTNYDLSYISNKFKIPLTKAGYLNQTYQNNIYKWRKNFISNINKFNELQQIYPIKEAPKINDKAPLNIDDLEPMDANFWTNANQLPKDKLYLPDINEYALKKIHLKPLNELDRLRLENQELRRQNQMLIDYIKSMNQKLIPQQQMKLNQLRESKNSVMNKNKELLKELPHQQEKLVNKLHNHFDSFIQQKKDEDKEYKQSSQSFDEWREAVKKSDESLEQLEKDLFTKSDDWEIRFNIYDKEGLKKLMPIMKKWFDEIIDKLPTNGEYWMSHRVGYKDIYEPYNKDLRDKLSEAVEKQCFIYDLEINPENTYAKEMEAEHWAIFDSIRIFKNPYYKGVNKENGGEFFPYLIDSSVHEVIKKELIKCQIFDNLTEHLKELDDCCFIYGLMMSNRLTTDELNKMRMMVKSKYLTQKNLKEICDRFKLKIYANSIDEEANLKHKKDKIRNHKNDYIGFDEATPERTFNFALIEGHWMLNEGKTSITSDYIKYTARCAAGEALDSPPNDAFNKRYKSVRGVYKWINCNDSRYFLSYVDLVRELMKQKKFIPITYATASILKTTLYESVKENDFSLEFDEESCLKLIEPKSMKVDKSNESNPPLIYHADFETDPTGAIHKPYSIVIHSNDGLIQKSFWGEDCAKQFLKFLPNNSIIFFYNLAYDSCFIFKELYSTFDLIRKSKSKVIRFKGTYYGKILEFRDMLPLFNKPLKALPNDFGITDIKKELFPYKYFTTERIKKGIGTIKGCGNKEDKIWSEKDYEEFIKNINSINGCRLSETTFDMRKYCEFYNHQDVKIQRIIYNKLADELKQSLGIDLINYLTSSSISDNYFSEEVYYPNGNLYKVGGHVREFISKAIYGGRCMTAFNKKWHTQQRLADIDAKSLYPSAIKRVWTVEGKPEVLKGIDSSIVHNHMPDYLLPYNTSNGIGAFIVEIKITAINKHYALPMIVKKTKDGNVNDDRLNEGKSIIMTVDNITLEDLIEFHQIEFQIIKGLVWNGNRDYKCREVIQKVFDSKSKADKEKNKALSSIYKLILNSTYGKTIQKPIDTQEITKKTNKKDSNTPSDAEKFIQKNYKKIIRVDELDGDKCLIKLKKGIDTQFNFSLFGVQILSMSKRIMNEITCLAYDIGCYVYYTDTDSFFIEANDVDKLETAFKAKYNRKMIGEQLGQFHSDFDKLNGEIPVSIEAYIIMKKCYIHKVMNSKGNVAYVKKMKGISQEAIESKSNGNLMDLYERIFNGECVGFNLADGKPKFEYSNSFTVKSLESYIRKVKGNYDLGEREKYFEY